MPCYQTNLMSVEFKAKNRALLIDAIKSLGWKFQGVGNEIVVTTGSYDTLTLRLDSQQAVIEASAQSQLNKLKVAYSQQVVKKASMAKMQDGKTWQRNVKTATTGTFYR